MQLLIASIARLNCVSQLRIHESQKMIHTPSNLPKESTQKKLFFALALSQLLTLAAVQAQTPDSKTATTFATAELNASSENSNVYRAGGHVRLTGPVKGDFYAVGGRLSVEHPVAGDAALTGGAVTVRAPIGDDLRAAGGDIVIGSTVGGELIGAGGNITLANSAVVAGAATLYAGSVTIDGTVKGPLKVSAQKIVINGQVGSDVELNAEQIELGPQARLGGALRYSSDAQFTAAEGSSISGAVARDKVMNGRAEVSHDRERRGSMSSGGLGSAGTVASVMVSFVALLAISALFLLTFTGFALRTCAALRATPWPALGAGAAVLLGTPTLAVLLLITLIGIPLGVALLMLFPLMLVLGWTVGVFCLAQRVQQAIQKNALSASTTTMMGFFALTLLLVLLMASLPLVGPLILVTIMLMGTGAFALELYRLVRPNGTGPAPSASMPTVLN